jgi:signal transduction histidine kinase
MREQIKTALHELRQTVSALRNPAELDIPLSEAIEGLVATFQSATNLTVHKRIAPDMPTLPPAHRLALFRAIQECLTNVQRHAGAEQMWLDLGVQNGSVTLTVSDDGRGFPAVIDDGRFGLAGIRERTEQLGGSIDLESSPQGGAAVRLQIPIDPVGERA